jgi:hypothetical protein
MVEVTSNDDRVLIGQRSSLLIGLAGIKFPHTLDILTAISKRGAIIGIGISATLTLYKLD